MNYPMQQNYGGGLGALGPVQSMSDRNDAQMMMANNGQMFAGGGITALAEGGTSKAEDLLPKYTYDPVLQRYTLVAPKESADSGLASLVAGSGGGSDASVSTPGGWDSMSNAEKAAYYAANPTMAAITQGLQKGFTNFTSIGRLAQAMNPIGFGEQSMIARGVDPGYMGQLNAQAAYNSMQDGFNTAYDGGLRGTTGDALGDYDGQGVTRGESTGYAPAGGGEAPSADSGGFTGADSNGGFGPSSAGELAAGGIASLAHGGPSHLGDYSDGGRLLRGPGDGVSDSIPASIGNKRPARLADGEFVVPARIVSELGNGSTEAGARKLYAMMDRIQKARGNTIGKDRVAVNSRAANNLPA